MSSLYRILNEGKLKEDTGCCTSGSFSGSTGAVCASDFQGQIPENHLTSYTYNRVWPRKIQKKYKSKKYLE